MRARRTRRERGSAFLAVGALLLLLAPGARAESVTLRWQYPAPERVASFRVHVGRTPGVYERSIDVGRPRPDAAGVYRAEIELEEGATHYLAVSAVDGSGREGARSNEWARPPRSAPLGTPGKPVVVVP